MWLSVQAALPARLQDGDVARTVPPAPCVRMVHALTSGVLPCQTDAAELLCQAGHSPGPPLQAPIWGTSCHRRHSVSICGTAIVSPT